MCQIWLRSDSRVEKKGGVQTDKGTLQLYIVDTLNVCEPTALQKNGPILFMILYKLVNLSGHSMAWEKNVALPNMEVI